MFIDSKELLQDFVKISGVFSCENIISMTDRNREKF